MGPFSGWGWQGGNGQRCQPHPFENVGQESVITHSHFHGFSSKLLILHKSYDRWYTMLLSWRTLCSLGCYFVIYFPCFLVIFSLLNIHQNYAFRIMNLEIACCMEYGNRNYCKLSFAVSNQITLSFYTQREKITVDARIPQMWNVSLIESRNYFVGEGPLLFTF